MEAEEKEDERFLGKPGGKTIIMKNGVKYLTKIGEDGRAVIERHNTDHNEPWAHTNPHDHPINWDNPDQHPQFQPAINYPDGVPEFNTYRGQYIMEHTIVPANSMEENRFESIADFKRSLCWGMEAEFVWKGIHYGVVRYGTNNKISVYVANRQETEKLYETPDDALDFMVGEDRLRDVITQVTVLDRTI